MIEYTAINLVWFKIIQCHLSYSTEVDVAILYVLVWPSYQIECRRLIHEAVSITDRVPSTSLPAQ